MSPTPSRPGSRVLALLRAERFGVMLGGNFLSATGTHIHLAVAAWVMFRLTRSSAMVATISLATQAPAIALTLPAGILADALDRRRWLVLLQTASMVLAGAVASLAWTGHLTAVVLLAFTVAMGVGNTLLGPAWIALVTDVVPAARAMTAFAFNSVSYHLAAALGPVFGALLYAAIGPGPAFALNAASFLAVIAALFALRTTNVRPAGGTRFRSAVGEIARFARASERVKRLVPVSGAISMLGFGLPSIFPAYASGVLHGNSRTFGALSGSFGAGSFLGAIALGVLADRAARRTAMVSGSWLIAIGAVLLLGARPYLAFPGAFAVGAGQLMFLVTSRTVIQMDAPEGLRARAVSLWFVAAVGLGPIGGLVLGRATDRLGIHPTLAGGALYGAAVALAVTVASRGRLGHVRPYEG